jgi:amino acid adenylation domain-containing protein
MIKAGDMHSGTTSLINGFLKSIHRFDSRTALVVDGQELTYLALYRAAGRIALAILREQKDDSPLVGIFACRSLTAYAGVLGILGAGKGYVPLNPKFPIARTRRMLILSDCSVIIAGMETLAQLHELLCEVTRCLTVILPDVSDPGALPLCLPQHKFVTSRDVGPASFPPPPETRRADIAYLLFTSGSTGEPKGVPISQSNVCSYLQYIRHRYDLNEYDRFSQAFDLTFDLSVHSMFLCWEYGACLVPVPERSRFAPAAFIRKQQLTVWFSVPSVIGVLVKLGLLQAGCFPRLRYSWFCGEPLPDNYAQVWQNAAPNSVLENLYGPTETTIAIASYYWDNSTSPKECRNGVVPLGQVYSGQRFRIIDQARNTVKIGDCGELCLSGSQVSSGYWKDSHKTEDKFIKLADGEEDRWYRTGDLVRQDASGCLHYLGRIDHQVKIRGYRVELQEIEAVLRRACGTEEVIAVAWPVNNRSAEAVVAFVSPRSNLDRQRVLAYCQEVLPEYMVPKTLYLLDDMPVNANGKVDRARLIKLLEVENESNVASRAYGTDHKLDQGIQADEWLCSGED